VPRHGIDHYSARNLVAVSDETLRLLRENVTRPTIEDTTFRPP
jgi:hypothetical protein